MKCARCGGFIFYQDCPTGSWWFHAIHPDDHHDAVLPDTARCGHFPRDRYYVVEVDEGWDVYTTDIDPSFT